MTAADPTPTPTGPALDAMAERLAEALFFTATWTNKESVWADLVKDRTRFTRGVIRGFREQAAAILARLAEPRTRAASLHDDLHGPLHDRGVAPGCGQLRRAAQAVVDAGKSAGPLTGGLGTTRVPHALLRALDAALAQAGQDAEGSTVDARLEADARAACIAAGEDPDQMVYPGITMPQGYTKPSGPARPWWTFKVPPAQPSGDAS